MNFSLNCWCLDVVCFPSFTGPTETYLQKGGAQVEGNEDGRQGGVSASHGVDGVEEDEVAGRHQHEENAGGARVQR